MAALKAVLFDLDDTLVPEMEPEREALLVVCGLAADRYGPNPEEMLKTVDAACRKFWAKWDTPGVYSSIAYSGWEGLWGPSDDPSSGLGNDQETISQYKRDAWDEVLSVYGIHDVELRDEIIERHRAERVARLVAPPGTDEMLTEIARDYPMAIVTNGSPAVQRLKLRQAGLADFFRGVVASGDVGVGKPHPLPFTTALDALGNAPGDAVMIGNSWNSDIQGAANLGMRSIWFNPDGGERPDTGESPTAEIRYLSEVPESIRIMARG